MSWPPGDWLQFVLHVFGRVWFGVSGITRGGLGVEEESGLLPAGGGFPLISPRRGQGHSLSIQQDAADQLQRPRLIPSWQRPGA